MISYTRNMTKTNSADRRRLSTTEIDILRTNGCTAPDWQNILVSEETDLARIRNVRFLGNVSIGALGVDEKIYAELANATLQDCVLDDEVTIRNIGSVVRGARIGEYAMIENVDRLEFEPEAECGLLISVNVLDETGSRPVPIYPGLSSQMAWLASRYPRWTEEELLPMLREEFADPVEPRIGRRTVVRDCGSLRNVVVGDGVTVEGALHLANGMIVNNVPAGRAPLAYVGFGVDADGFIIEDGRVDAGSLLRNCYVGQGVIVDKGFTAHDTLMFANTTLENGEACALFAGPYTVSMHKASLLIGCETSFMNAGSGTNQSNHMYKLGPVHWGLMQRGAKTASSSYIMWGAKIGAFSLLMGTHKNHPDATDFPFSYLFGDEKGATTVVPAMMLRSCGLQRDEKKWPLRDRRRKHRLHLNDRISFPVINPATVSMMRNAMPIIDTLIAKGVDDDLFIRHKGMKLRAPSLDRAKQYYTMAIAYYLNERLGDEPFPQASAMAEGENEWLDVGGQIVTVADVLAALKAESRREIEQIFDRAEENFAARELRWIAATFAEYWADRRALMKEFAAMYLQLIEDDRADYLRKLAAENAMLLSDLPPLPH